MIRSSGYKLFLLFILFVCTVVILYDFDKLNTTMGKEPAYTSNVAGIINTNEIFYSKEKYKNILSKNIFADASNKDFKPVKKPESSVVSKTFPFTVNGIFTSPDESIVMISEIRNNKTQFITVGESIDDWKLESVNKRHVVFAKSSGEKNTFELNVESEQK